MTNDENESKHTTPEELLRQIRAWLIISKGEDGRERTAWPELVAQIDATLATTPPDTPVVATAIAKDVVNEILNVPRFVRNPESTIIEIENKIAAIITRHFAATTSPSETAVGGEAQKCVKCGHDNYRADLGYCIATITLDDYGAEKDCNCNCEFAAPVIAAGDDDPGSSLQE